MFCVPYCHCDSFCGIQETTDRRVEGIDGRRTQVLTRFLICLACSKDIVNVTLRV